MTQAVQTVVLDVEGMKCGGCVRAVERTLLEQPGVQRVDVNLVSRAAWLDLENDAGSVEAVLSALTDRASRPVSDSWRMLPVPPVTPGFQG